MKQLVTVILLLLTTFLLSAENLIQTEVSVYNTLIATDFENANYTMGGAVDLSFNSSGYRNMKGTVSILFADGSQNPLAEYLGAESPISFSLVSLNQLEIKARFPDVRLTTGLTRLDWGEGTLLNSANVLFSDDVESVALDQSTIELQKKWLLSLQKPLSAFSFLEGAVAAPSDGNVKHSTGGIRYYNGEHSVAWEGGLALTRDETIGAMITPHIAISGGALVEWYASASSSFSLGAKAAETAKNSLSTSAGIYQIFSFDTGSSLTARMEGRYLPFSDSAMNLLLYPSVAYALSNGAQLSVQSIINVSDLSATLTAGGSWNILEGFTMSAYGAVNTGENDEVYEYRNVTATLGFTALF